MKYKSTQPKKLFDEEFRLEKLAEQKDPLVKLRERIDFEMFRPLLEELCCKEQKGVGGARPFDYVMMFKILNFTRFSGGTTNYRIAIVSQSQLEFQNPESSVCAHGCNRIRYT
jgi:hypothetical protein